MNILTSFIWIVIAILILSILAFKVASRRKRAVNAAINHGVSNRVSGTMLPIQAIKPALRHVGASPLSNRRSATGQRVNPRWRQASRQHLSSSTYNTIIWDDEGLDLPPLFILFSDGGVMGPDGQQYTDSGTEMASGTFADYSTPQGDSGGGADFSPQVVTSDFTTAPVSPGADAVWRSQVSNPVYEQPDNTPQYQAPDPPASSSSDYSSSSSSSSSDSGSGSSSSSSDSGSGSSGGSSDYSSGSSGGSSDYSSGSSSSSSDYSSGSSSSSSDSGSSSSDSGSSGD